MKKILFATTALVASTSFAMAQDTNIDLSGSAEMGIFGADEIDTQFHTDIDVTFSMSGETDAGLAFGASIDLDESDTDTTIPGIAVNEDEDESLVTDGISVGGSPAFDNSTQGGETIFVSGTFGTLTMGDTDGAYDFALSEAIIGSAITDNHEHAGYSGNGGLDGTYDGQIARYDYTFGDFSFAISAEISDDPDGDDDEIDIDFDNIDDDIVLGVGATYDGVFGGFDFGVGIGYQRAGMGLGVDADGDGEEDDMDSSIYGISVDGSMDNGIQAVFNYSVAEVDDSVDGRDDFDHLGLAVGYEFSGVLVAANYGVFDYDNGDEDSGFGVVANYDLGGGAELQAGYGYSENDFDDDTVEDTDGDTFSFGISMSF